MNEADLVEIRTALEQPTLEKAIEAMEATLERLGYERFEWGERGGIMEIATPTI